MPPKKADLPTLNLGKAISPSSNRSMRLSERPSISRSKSSVGSTLGSRTRSISPDPQKSVRSRSNSPGSPPTSRLERRSTTLTPSGGKTPRKATIEIPTLPQGDGAFEDFLKSHPEDWFKYVRSDRDLKRVQGHIENKVKEADIQHLPQTPRQWMESGYALTGSLLGMDDLRRAKNISDVNTIPPKALRGMAENWESLFISREEAVNLAISLKDQNADIFITPAPPKLPSISLSRSVASTQTTPSLVDELQEKLATQEEELLLAGKIGMSLVEQNTFLGEELKELKENQEKLLVEWKKGIGENERNRIGLEARIQFLIEENENRNEVNKNLNQELNQAYQDLHTLRLANTNLDNQIEELNIKVRQITELEQRIEEFQGIEDSLENARNEISNQMLDRIESLEKQGFSTLNLEKESISKNRSYLEKNFPQGPESGGIGSEARTNLVLLNNQLTRKEEAPTRSIEELKKELEEGIDLNKVKSFTSEITKWEEIASLKSAAMREIRDASEERITFLEQSGEIREVNRENIINTLRKEITDKNEEISLLSLSQRESDLEIEEYLKPEFCLSVKL